MKKILLSLMALFAFTAMYADDVVDVLDQSVTGISGTTYKEFSDKTVTSSAVYAGQCAGGNNSIQLRSNNNNSGVVSTVSGGKIKKVVVTWNSNTANGRTLNVYGSNTAFTSATELYGTTSATLLGTIVNGTSTELEITDDYAFVGFRSASGAMYLDKVELTWSTGSAPSDPVAVESVALTDAAGNALGMYTALTVTDKMQVKAVVTPANATNKKVTWEVMQESPVISFDEATGTVTALAEGRAALVATTEDGEKEAATTFVVSPIADGTIADFIAAEGKTCYLTGVVSNIKNTTYGNFDLTDESGTIYVYGCLNADGESKKFAELGVSEGDKIKVLASKFTIYAGTNEAVDVVFVENYGPAAPAVTFNVVPGAETFTVTPSDLEAKYYVEVQPAGILEAAKEMGYETMAGYYDYLLGEMGEGLEYFSGVQTQSYEEDWYIDEPGDYEIYVFAVDENYKRTTDVSMTPFTYTIASDNTIEAGKYTLTADVALAEGVTEAMVPADFKKYIGTYTSNATLVGDEKSLIISENDEAGLFTGFEIKGDAVALAAEKTITLNGKVFNVRTAADEENGSLAITAEGDNYKMDAANVWYNGKKVATITNIVIAKAAVAPVVAIEKGEGTITVTSTSETAALYFLCKPMSWLDEGETPESLLLADIAMMASMVDSEETWEMYGHMGMEPAPKTLNIADYQEMYAGQEMFIIAANVGWDGEKLAVISNIVEETFTVPAPAPVVAIEKGEGTYTVTSTSETAALYFLCKPMSWLEGDETPESLLLADIAMMASMVDSEETWEMYGHMGMEPAPKTLNIADYQEMYAGQKMFIIAANVGWDGEKLAVISNIVEETFTVPGSTGIKNVTAAKALNAKFIENGKLVIISNGKKFNAAGVEMK